MSANYRLSVRGIRELHRLLLADLDESPEADAIRDATDLPWEALSETERDRVGGISEDLYSISDPPVDVPREINPQARAAMKEAIEARDCGEWDHALSLLRRWSKHLPPAFVSRQRGLIWQAAGDAETAALFLEHAARLEQKNGRCEDDFLEIPYSADEVQVRPLAQD